MWTLDVALVAASISLPAAAPAFPLSVGRKAGAVSALVVAGRRCAATADSSTPANWFGEKRR